MTLKSINKQRLMLCAPVLDKFIQLYREGSLVATPAESQKRTILVQLRLVANLDAKSYKFQCVHTR